MPASALLLAAGGWVEVLIPVVVFVLWAAGQLIGRLNKPAPPPAQRGNVGGNPRPAAPRPQAVDDEIEEFLRRAAQNRPGGQQPAARPQPQRPLRPQPQLGQRPQQPQRPQPQSQRPQQPQRPAQPQRAGGQRPAAPSRAPGPAQQPQRPSQVVQAVEVVEEPKLGAGVSQHVAQFLDSRILDNDPNTQSRVEFADDLMEKHIHQAFDHKLGQLGSTSSESTSSGERVGMAPSSPAAGLATLLANPGNMRTAIILHEILQPRAFEGDYPLLPGERP